MASSEVIAALESVADASQAAKTKLYSDLLHQLTSRSPSSPDQHSENLIAYTDSILSSSLGIITTRPLLTTVIQSLNSAPSQVKVKVGAHIVDSLQPQTAPFEEQDATLREI